MILSLNALYADILSMRQVYGPNLKFNLLYLLLMLVFCLLSLDNALSKVHGVMSISFC